MIGRSRVYQRVYIVLSMSGPALIVRQGQGMHAKVAIIFQA